MDVRVLPVQTPPVVPSLARTASEVSAQFAAEEGEGLPLAHTNHDQNGDATPIADTHDSGLMGMSPENPDGGGEGEREARGDANGSAPPHRSSFLLSPCFLCPCLLIPNPTSYVPLMRPFSFCSRFPSYLTSSTPLLSPLSLASDPALTPPSLRTPQTTHTGPLLGDSDDPTNPFFDLARFLPLKTSQDGIVVMTDAQDPTVMRNLYEHEGDVMEMSEEQRMVYNLALAGESIFFTGYAPRTLLSVITLAICTG